MANINWGMCNIDTQLLEMAQQVVQRDYVGFIIIGIKNNEATTGSITTVLSTKNMSLEETSEVILQISEQIRANEKAKI